MQILNRPLRVMHIISGDLWAGAEAQAFTLLKHLSQTVELKVVLMNSGELAQRLKALGIPTSILPETQLNSWQIVTALVRHIRQFAPDILHTHRQKENILGNFACVIAAMFLPFRPRSLRTSHGAPEFAPVGKQRLQVGLDNWVGRNLQQAIIAVSTELKAKLAQVYPPAKIHVVNNGVDTECLLAEAQTADFKLHRPASIHLGIIGRLEPVKRIDLFLSMAERLLQGQPDTALQFHVIGDGRLKPQLESQARQLGIENAVIFHGHRRDIASCIKSLDYIVMCSDHEGTPMTALEALALGTPLIAHNTGGLRDILQEFPALLVDNHQAQGYADCIAGLLSREQPLRVALKPIYQAQTNARSTLALYQQLLAG